MNDTTLPSRGLFWPGLVIGLIVMQIALCVIAAVLATRAPGGQIVRDVPVTPAPSAAVSEHGR
ncbi:MAG: hypothetical protein GC162_14960 [Planctomycetes bacterium]|nr:hypothetical protein [Planctomycetota bacterium]